MNIQRKPFERMRIVRKQASVCRLYYIFVDKMYL